MKKGIKVVAIGGGSTYTPELIRGFIERYDELPVEEIWLVDIEQGARKLDIIYEYVVKMVEHHKVPIHIYKTLHRKEALPNADYVITQLRVGGIESRILDETIPAKYNMIGQESIGIGGMFQALRTIPVLLDIIKDIKQYCDGAWLINVSNPTGIISEAVFRYAEYEKYIGISTITNYLASHFAKKLGAKEKDIIPYFAGLYQMSYVINVYYKHRNSLRDILEHMDETELKFKNDGTPSWDASFIKQLGAYPGPYLKYYYHYEEMLKRYLHQVETNHTRAEDVKKIELGLLVAYQQDGFNLPPSERGGTYYSDVACSVISSIHNDKRDYHVLITANNRAITDVPEGCAIEVTCRVTTHGVVPVYIGTLPDEIKGLIQHMKTYEELLVDAILERDLEKALFAYQVHPLCTSIQQAKQAFHELVDVHREYLDYYFEE